MKKILLISLSLLTFKGVAQTIPDTSKRLKEVVIRPYFSAYPQLRSTGAYGLIDSLSLQRQSGTSFVPAMNTIAGLRMEERSPGSYRLSIRGSLLRSPFGIRNVKIYLDEFPLTDAGGNTYLNGIDVEGVEQVQVLKGPQSSIYGANSGGVVLISPMKLAAGDSTAVNFGIKAGSYGLFKENLQLGKQWKNYQLAISQAYQRSDGYRDHSAMDRKYIQLYQGLQYAPSANLKSLIFYSDLHYNTPGGLNATQYAQDPKGSRPATAATRSAIEQQAGIYSKTLYGGISNEWQLSDRIKHVAAVYSSYTDFKNPFISNYEHRKEFTLGLRTYLEYAQQKNDLSWKFNLGLESMQTSTDFDNFDNEYGIPAAVQAIDELKATSNVAFAHLNLDFNERWLLELSASANLYKYQYESIEPVALARRSNKFDVQLMPRVALSYLVNPVFSVYANVSKGYSPPTLAEVRASDNVINVDLQAELGWNYETGFKYAMPQKRLYLDVTGFYYNLKNAIVRRLNENGTEYFVNAGGTKQWGLETAFSAWLLPYESSRSLINSLELRNALTLSRFEFSNYIDGSTNYNGNDLTGVPQETVVSSLDFQLRKGWYVFLQHNYTSAIPLNDANTVFADKYHLLQAKVGLKTLKIGKQPVDVFVGADNLLNENYSLGNDLNAFGGRYFNAAPRRNFYAGFNFRLK